MKANVLLLILIGAVLFLQSCAPSRLTKMSAVASSGQKLGHEDTITSRKKHFVSLAPYTELNIAKDMTMLMLGVQNLGERPLDFGYGNISIRFQGSATDQPANSIRVQPYDELFLDVWEEQSAREKKYIRDELEDVIIKLDSSSSSFSSSSMSSGSSMSEGGMSSGDSMSSDSSDTTGESVEIMLEDLEMDIETMRANNQLLREALPEIIMKPLVTIMPGRNYSGVVVCDTRDLGEKLEGRFQVAVLVGEEEHIFTFNRVLNK